MISRLRDTLTLDKRTLEQLREGSIGDSDAEPISEDDYSDNGQDMAKTDNQVCTVCCASVSD